MVFWGVNGSPPKYGLLDSIEIPGHNVTGVYQADYLKESITFLKGLLPEIYKVGVLSDDSLTGRTKVKEINQMSRSGEMPIKIVKTVLTNSYKTWKSEALAMQDKVDAFFVLNHNTLKDAQGRPLDQMEVGAWYLRHIKKPDISYERHFVVEGMLSGVGDSGVKQGYEAMKIAHRILHGGEDPAKISVYAPERGNFVINRERAQMLGILQRIEKDPMIEEWIEKSLALERYP